jgi:hypothetical protein
MSNNEQEVIRKLFLDRNIDELNSFFKNKDLNSQLNEAAHPSLNHHYFKEVIQGDPFNERMYNYIQSK